jgi:hypothetical protein
LAQAPLQPFASAPRERITSVLGSMLFAAGTAAVISMLLLLARGTPPEPSQLAWLWIVSTLGTWSVLVPAAQWQAAPGDGTLRRFAMLVIGLGVGVAGWGLSEYLNVDLPRTVDVGRDLGEGVAIRLAGLFRPDGAPLYWAFILFFGLLFLALRWWRQADPLRARRVSLGATALAVTAAWVIHIFCPFPQPWCLMVAATISLATQLSSPWQGKR